MFDTSGKDCLDSSSIVTVGGILLAPSRCVLIALICCGMVLLQIEPTVQAAPATASQANGLPFAVIVFAHLAHVGAANAAAGTTVYPGDALDAASGGELRLRVAGGQVYLLSDTEVKLDNVGSVLQARLLRGTVGFSSLTDRQFVILAPEGEVQAANEQPGYGQVSVTGPNDVVISAYTGALALHRGDQTLIVNAGRSYYASLMPEEASAETNLDTSRRKLIWRLIMVGTAAGVGYWLWRIKTESPVDP